MMDKEQALAEIPTKTYFFVRRGNEAAWSLVKKLSQNTRDGAIIPLTDEEFHALQHDFVQVKVECPS